MKKIVYIVAIIIAIQACQKDIDLKIPEHEPKIALNTQLSVGDSLRYICTKSKKILSGSDTFERVEPVTFTLKENGVVIYNGTQPNFEGVLPVVAKANTDYEIEVSADNLPTINASSHIPTIPIVNSVQLTDSAYNSITGSYDYEYTFNISDENLVINYYTLSIFNSEYYIDFITNDTIWYDYELCLLPMDLTFDQKPNSSGLGSTDLECYYNLTCTDENFANTTISFKVGINGFNSSVSNAALRYKLISSSEEYYRYNISYKSYLESQYNPFAEPISVFSNVNNGYGIFAGYSYVIGVL